MIVVLFALVALTSPVVLRAVNNNPLKYSESHKKRKTESTIEKNSIETLTTDVKETEIKKVEDSIKKTKEKELQDEYTDYLAKVPFGDFIDLKTENDGKVSLSIAKVIKLKESDERVKAVKAEIRDVSQVVEIEYDVYVSEGDFLFNSTIFQYFDEKNDQGAVILDDLEEGKTLNKGERQTAKACIALKNEGDKISVKIGNATFVGNIG
ncbi:hypothetical protein [Vagococcus carniphilus]|uniref:DUF4352 domain-containing protein n=1 Tax=Vagococcus carniphilus TaxID=218144 RepID=A0AAW8UAR7_9ENTE|nr:hypothetical protein [Vagococcus carniphilus]MDT2813816.1 hypothetical protein [Vagococcus carniphilus]MDT2829818.1 hypothetical protein [Vagococcus carniphilus]MDT2834804.1 hypothetical protein [Vagococcus carniphilus]MDT2838252.1 hypothetical protein [Vagococcus carniphilus]MDT2854248.1 hypothetical protein [Vagococcus carniphilus]